MFFLGSKKNGRAQSALQAETANLLQTELDEERAKNWFSGQIFANMQTFGDSFLQVQGSLASLAVLRKLENMAKSGEKVSAANG